MNVFINDLSQDRIDRKSDDQQRIKRMTSTTSTRYNSFGWGQIRSAGRLSQPWFAYTILCFCTFVQNFSVNGANNAVISTVERAFHLNSVQSGFFLALYDLATVCSAPIIGYLGDFYSSPILFALNMIIVAMGNLLIASSNFVINDIRLTSSIGIGSEYSSNDNVLYQCGSNRTSNVCSRIQSLADGSKNARILLYFGNFINGVGSVALFTIGVAYIERIFPREKAAYCQGIYFAVGTIGGALGIVATGQFLSFYTKLTPRRRLPSWLVPGHPLWIGCWWLPYLIYGFFCLLMGLIVCGLPNYKQPGRKTVIKRTNTIIPSINTQNEHREMPIIRENSPGTETIVTVCSDFPTCETEISKTSVVLPDLIVNESYLSHRKLPPLKLSPSTLAVPDSTSASGGHFNPGFISENVTDQSIRNESNSIIITSNTNLNDQSLSTSPTSVKTTFEQISTMFLELMKNSRYVLIIVANLFEGILIKGFVPFVTKYFEYQHQLDTSMATLVTGAIALLSVIIGCPIGAFCINKFSWNPVRCARICALTFTISSILFLFLIISCPELKFQPTDCSNLDTGCCQTIYRPVCDTNKNEMMYLSPCHYGCTSQKLSSSGRFNEYASCQCSNNATLILSESACQFRSIPCLWIFILTLTGAAFVVFLTAFIQVPMLHVLLYSVPATHQSMALALRQTIVRVLGQTTGPLLFGFVFDQSCLVWLTDCYGRKTCKVYNNQRMGLSMALSGFSTRFITGTACGIVYFKWKSRQTDENNISTN